MVRYIGYIVFMLLIAIVTFFGMGPVLLADGSMLERAATFAVVVIIYVVLIKLFGKWERRFRK